MKISFLSLPKSFWKYDFPIIVKMILPAFFVVFVGSLFNEFVMRSVYANTMLNSGIILTASCGFMLIFVRLINLQNDMRALLKFRKEATEENMKELLNEEWIQKRAVRHYLEPIASTEGKLSSQLDQSAIQHELQALSDEYISKMELPQFIVGFMIALGLLGTFIGLLSTLTGISGMLDSMGNGGNIEQEFTKLVSELRKPLAGMGIAFSSSMFGLIFSLMLAVMMTMLRRYTSRVIETARSVMNHVTTRIDSSGDSSGSDVSDLHQGSSAKDVSIQMVNSINMLVKRMDGVAKSLDRNIDETRKTNELLGFGPRLRETSDQLLQEVRSFANHHDDNQKTLRKIVNGLIQIEQALMANSTNDLLVAQKEVASKVGDVFTGTQTISNLLGSILESQRESGADIFSSIREASDLLVQEIKSVHSTQKDGQKTFQKVSNSLVQIDQSLLANSPKELLIAQQETTAKLNEMFVISQTLSRIAGSSLDAQKEGDSEIVQILKGLHDRFIRLEDVNVSSSGLLEDMKKDLSRATSSLSGVEDISENIGRQTVLLELSQDQTREYQDSLNENLQQKAQELIDVLSNVVKKQDDGDIVNEEIEPKDKI